MDALGPERRSARPTDWNHIERPPFAGPFDPFNEHHHTLLLEKDLPGGVGLAFVEPRTGYGLVDAWAKNARRKGGNLKWHMWVLRPDGSFKQICNRSEPGPARFVTNPLGRRCNRCDRFLQGQSPFYATRGNPLWPAGVHP